MKQAPSYRLVGAATLAVMGALVCVGTVDAGQQQQRPPLRDPSLQQGQQLTEQVAAAPQFTGAVDRVLVDVTVVDDDGNFVPDLSLDDFTVLEEGREVDLTFFALERFREEVAWSDADGGEAEDTVLLPATLASAPVLPRYLVLFVDGFNTSPADWEQVRYALNRYLDTQVQDNDRILLATLTPSRRLMVAPEFTQDVESLKRSINGLVTNPYIVERQRQQQQELLFALYQDASVLALSVTAADSQVAADIEANALRHGASLAQAFAGQRKDEILYTIDSMTSLAAHLSQTFDVPGPKTMIMVSAGIARSPGNIFYYILDERLQTASLRARNDAPQANQNPFAYRSQYASTIESYLTTAIGKLNRLNYTLYTIGAMGPPPVGTDASMGVRTNLTPGLQSTAFRDGQEGLRMLANGTGGLAFDNSANFGAAFDQIDRDTAFRYVLGYAPPERNPRDKDDKFYRIQVRVDRDDINVRARRGYVNG